MFTGDSQAAERDEPVARAEQIGGSYGLRDRAMERPMTVDEIMEIIACEAMTVLPHVSREQIDRETRLVELGADSLDRSEIVQQSMRKAGIRLRPVQLMGIENVGGLADRLAQASADA